jgi:DnaJ-domain-containing protein 1
MLSTIILILIFHFCVNSLKFANFKIRGCTKLHCVRAKQTDQSITPPTYESDLYKVLGISTGANLDEIKQAYKRKVYQNHPDRNKTMEALHVFRNVTYAYQILGKNKNLKYEYDAKYQARK